MDKAYSRSINADGIDIAMTLTLKVRTRNKGDFRMNLIAGQRKLWLEIMWREKTVSIDGSW